MIVMTMAIDGVGERLKPAFRHRASFAHTRAGGWESLSPKGRLSAVAPFRGLGLRHRHGKCASSGSDTVA